VEYTEILLFFCIFFFLGDFLGDLAAHRQFCIESVGLWLLSALYSDFGNVLICVVCSVICLDARESHLVLRIVFLFFFVCVFGVLRVVICFVFVC